MLSIESQHIACGLAAAAIMVTVCVDQDTFTILSFNFILCSLISLRLGQWKLKTQSFSDNQGVLSVFENLKVFSLFDLKNIDFYVKSEDSNLTFYQLTITFMTGMHKVEFLLVLLYPGVTKFQRQLYVTFLM